MKRTAARQATKTRRTPRKAAQPEAAHESSTAAGSIADFYAQAIAIEREAAERYRELAAQMSSLGNREISRLFETLAGYEERHAEELKERAKGMKLPRLPAGAHSWLESGPTEIPRYELLYSRVQPHHVLLLALRAERRAKEFFERIGERSTDAEVRKLALVFAREEADHVARIERALESELPQPRNEDPDGA